MTCNCNNGSSCDDAVRVVAGNDFTMMVDVRRPVMTSIEDFDLTTCTGIEVKLVSRLGRRRKMPFKVEDGRLRIDFDETVRPGIYGMEIKGKDKDGRDWRFFAKPGEWIEVVDASSDENNPDHSTGYYSKTIEFGIVSGAGGVTLEAIPDTEALARKYLGTNGSSGINPDNPDKPDNPDNPDTPDKPDTGDDEPISDDDITDIINDVENGDTIE